MPGALRHGSQGGASAIGRKDDVEDFKELIAAFKALAFSQAEIDV